MLVQFGTQVYDPKYTNNSNTKNIVPSTAQSVFLDKPTANELVERIPTDTQLVLFGELHHTRHLRSLVKNTMQRMYNKGFRVLAIEISKEFEACFKNEITIGSPTDQISQGLAFCRPSLMINKDAEYASFLNIAKEAQLVGMQVIPVDHLLPSSQTRDQLMLNNMLPTLNKGTKIIFYGGISHTRIQKRNVNAILSVGKEVQEEGLFSGSVNEDSLRRLVDKQKIPAYSISLIEAQDGIHLTEQTIQGKPRVFLEANSDITILWDEY